MPDRVVAQLDQLLALPAREVLPAGGHAVQEIQLPIGPRHVVELAQALRHGAGARDVALNGGSLAMAGHGAGLWATCGRLVEKRGTACVRLTDSPRRKA